MIRIVTLVAMLSMMSSAIAQPEIQLNVTLDPPETREGGAKLDPEDIGGFNLYMVDGDDLIPLPSIPYNGTGVDSSIMAPVNEAEGVVIVCAKTVDKLLLETSACETRVEVPFVVPPPAAPGGLTVEQINDININININITGEQ